MQNHYNLIHRTDDRLVAELARDGIAYTALEGVSYTSFFPMGEMTPPQAAVLATVAGRVGASPLQVAVAWLLARSPNVLVIPGATTVAELEEAAAAAGIVLSGEPAQGGLLQGQAPPGASVTLDGKPVAAAADGFFAAVLQREAAATETDADPE